MKRKDFFKKGIIGLGAFVSLPAAVAVLPKDGKVDPKSDGDCELSPSETRGPFPNKKPADLVRANIISDREGIPLLMTLTVQNKRNNCEPLPGVFVDVWHCDSHGNYSEYGGMRMQRTDFTKAHFLRGRQTTDENGQVSFISIYPGYYRGRAPHIHVEVRDSEERSLLVSQIAFPDEVSDEVYVTASYQGKADTSNASDGIFRNSLEDNMGAVSGNTADGYTLTHSLIVNG